MIWHVPTWTGDYRLFPDPARSPAASPATILFIEEPNVSEVRILRDFLKQAGTLGWCPATHPRLTERTRVELVLSVHVSEAVRRLVEIALPGKELWTGVKSVAGDVSLFDGVPSSDEIALPPEPEEEAESEEAVAAEKAAGKGKPRGGRPRRGGRPAAAHAATVVAPRTGCPAPEPCNVRASEVLAKFCTLSQRADWERTGSMKVIGGDSGRAYRIFHRNEAARLGLNHSVIDDTGTTKCVWGQIVPAEEEALAIKFMIEHREERILYPHGRL